jgi:uncharacterized protein
MPPNKASSKPAVRRSRTASETAPEQARRSVRTASAPAPAVSGRWLLKAVGAVIAIAAVCCWGVLCLLFWQGSWQLLYHPASKVTRTPASAGLAFDSLAFAVADSGQARLTGWWIPAGPNSRFSRYTFLYLHGKDGNLGDTVDALAELHAAGVNVLAFDYRGYGQSQFVHPSEARGREDADWAIEYLTGTRHVAPGAIVLVGEGLGADLALETAAAHPELAGVVLREPVADAANAIFSDARAQLVPAQLLVRDRYDLKAAAANLRVASLWFYRSAAPGSGRADREPDAFQKVTARKMLVWLSSGTAAQKELEDALSRWLDDLKSESR